MNNEQLRLVYRNGFDLLKRARGKRAWIEVVCLQESFLIARLAAMHGAGRARIDKGAGELVQSLRKHDPRLVSAAFEARVRAWMKLRGGLVHRMFVADDADLTRVLKRYAGARAVAVRGDALIRAVRRLESRRCEA